MKSSYSRDMEKAIISILDSKPPGFRINICCESDMEDFFKLERDGVCRYFLKN